MRKKTKKRSTNTGNREIPFSETGTGQVQFTKASTTYIIPQKKPLPMHRQSRSYLKTAGSITGRDTEQTSLFKSPSYQNNTNPYKEVITKKTSILGNHLIHLWQKDRDDRGILTIDNLTKIAKVMGIIPQDLKLYLIYLAGYQYPVTKFNKETRIFSIYSDKLFYIKFNMRLKEGESENSFTNDDRIGTNYISFIKDRDVDSVEVSPSMSIIEELNGKGSFGNVLVDDKFVAFSLGLSDLAYKIFCFISSNKPAFKMSFKKLISKKHLNLEKQVHGVYDSKGKRKQAGKGKPRMLTRIKEAFDELLDEGHLSRWTYDEEKDLFSWTYTDKIIKHKDLLPKPKK
jgi:hypothetical protein